MDEIKFRNWMSKAGKNKKLQSDMVSRLKAIQRELGNCDLDTEYATDCCEKIFDAMKNKGINKTMESYGDVKLPIGKYTLSVYRYSLRTYIRFLEENNKTKEVTR